MTTRRKAEELETRSWFRSDRMFQEGRNWFFQTREGTVEGPYGDRMEAARRLDAYVMVMNSSFGIEAKFSIQSDEQLRGPPGEKKVWRKNQEKTSIPAFSLEPISS